MEKIGICVGTTSPNRVMFISQNPIKLGQFVNLRYTENGKENKLLGMVINVQRKNTYIPEDLPSINNYERLFQESAKDTKVIGEIQILGEIIETQDQVFLQLQRVPPLPASEVLKPDLKVLEKLFGAKSKSHIRIGKLLAEDEEIPVYIDVNQIVLRHLAILAITGAGKSNTVSVLLENIVNLKGTVVVFDFHGEYTKSEFKRDGKNVVNVIKPVVDPTTLDIRDFAKLIGIKYNATVQFRYFKIAVDRVIQRIQDEKGNDWKRWINTDEFFYRLEQELESWLDDDNDDVPIKGKIREDSLYEVINKLNDTQNELSHIIKIGAKDLIENIQAGKINVFDLSEVDEDVADAIVSNILKHALEERKKAVRGKDSKLEKPILVVVEEAHILAGDKIDTDSKYYMMRIAREGRKFGLGLCIVTQRPKGLDKEILSQMNNMIILKLVEPEDQKHVQSASEALSSELMSYLPSLNPGEAIIIGNMTKLPLLVKIDKAKGKLQGNDIPVVDLWTITEEKRGDLQALDEF
ncbi:helicase HerA domain-containing protein [Sulfurihydrogenibium subterraneum]|uniref:helicase HerA domain-containing protein n=1 Tax=Sulfurihydrogenibium subterraneum TaxID=171121 RepID=UPI00048BBFC4|nr:ATP-binding protein [Sulfurihydrogenibium subterraneum]